MNRLELAGESVRAAVEALAVAHLDWLAQRIRVSDWTTRYGTPTTAWRPLASQGVLRRVLILITGDPPAPPSARVALPVAIRPEGVREAVGDGAGATTAVGTGGAVVAADLAGC